MPIASPWYRFDVRRPEKILKITTLLHPGFMDGQVIDLSGKLYIIVGITHHLGVSGTSTMEVVESSWFWKVKYRFKQTVRRVFRPLIRAWNRLVHGNPYG